MLTQPLNRNFRQLLLRATIVAACAALSCGAGIAADDVSMATHFKDGSYDIKGSFYVPADTSVVWDVLTGYEHIPKFVGSLKKSHVTEDLGVYHFLLEQEFEGGFLFIRKSVRVLLDVHETWYQTIAFTDTVHKDFATYQGSWELSKDPTKGLEVTYTLKTKPNFTAPFGGDFMTGGAKDLLEAVRREILRRQVIAEKEKIPPVLQVTQGGTALPKN